MAFKTLKEQMASKLPGVGLERVEVRAQGCWNCKNFDREAAQKLWWEKARNDQLQKAVIIAMKHPLGEACPQVLAIRDGIPKIDGMMTAGGWGACKVGKKPDGNPVGDFVNQTYLCGQWTGAVGSSVAREGGALDKLPEELMENMTGMDPALLDDSKLS